MPAGKKFLVTGFGRTGSHWVADNAAAVLKMESGDILFDVEKWAESESGLLHTNETKSLIDLDESIRANCIMLWARRKDIFTRTISLYVARHSNEWYVYSNRLVRPFSIDPTEFIEQLESHEHLTMMMLARVLPLYPDVRTIWYEDMVRYKHVAGYYVAKIMDLPYEEPAVYYSEKKNLRNYSDIVENYHELKYLYDLRLSERYK